MMRPEVEKHFPAERDKHSLSDEEVMERLSIVEEIVDGKPTVCVGIIRFHSYKHPEWWLKCSESVLRQTGIGVRLVALDAHDDFCSIGEGLNILVSHIGDAEWFYHLSDDDWFRSEDALSHLAAVGDGAEADIVQHRSVIVDTEGRSWMQGPGTMGLLRAKLVQEEAFTRRSLLEDREWITRVVKKGAHIAKTPRAIHAYRMHEKQASGVLKEEAGLYDDLKERGAWID